jgi:alpha-tubulin suppressor-like RCC1 family protein
MPSQASWAAPAQCWGENIEGQLGDGSTPLSPTPVSVTGLSSGVSSIAAGENHACVLSNGGLKCWGYNNQGQLGNNNTTNSATPTPTNPLQ